MAGLLRGALIEYGSDFLGPLPNVVIFQFNPESLTRVLQMPPRPGGASAREATQAGEPPCGASAREATQAGEPPLERLTVRAEFDAAYLTGTGQNALVAGFGIGPQLAALEKMARPSNALGGAVGAALDAIGGALGLGGGAAAAEQPVPREKFPRILFIWGLTRVVPVAIESMTIAELHYDALLNPTHAEVSIGLAVLNLDACSEDVVGKGAQEFTKVATEAKAALNLVHAASLAVDLIPF